MILAQLVEIGFFNVPCDYYTYELLSDTFWYGYRLLIPSGISEFEEISPLLADYCEFITKEPFLKNAEF